MSFILQSFQNGVSLVPPECLGSLRCWAAILDRHQEKGSQDLNTMYNSKHIWICLRGHCQSGRSLSSVWKLLWSELVGKTGRKDRNPFCLQKLLVTASHMLSKVMAWRAIWMKRQFMLHNVPWQKGGHSTVALKRFQQMICSTYLTKDELLLWRTLIQTWSSRHPGLN